MASLINAKKVKRERKILFNRMLKDINIEREILYGYGKKLNKSSYLLKNNNWTGSYRPNKELYISSLYDKIEDLIKICQSQDDKIFVLENKIKNDEKIIIPTKYQVEVKDTLEDDKSSVQYEESSEDESVNDKYEYLDTKKCKDINKYKVRPADCSLCAGPRMKIQPIKGNKGVGYIKNGTRVYHVCNDCEIHRIQNGGNPNLFIEYTLQ